MSTRQPISIGSMFIAQVREFASFTPREQQYILRSLDIAQNNEKIFFHWERDVKEGISVQEQIEDYAIVNGLRRIMPQEYDESMIESFMGPLIKLTVSDLARDYIDSFCAYRFLYERLLGALVRPWLPSTFCAAAAVPDLRPDRRKKLLQSISEASATASSWSKWEPFFIPKRVNNIDEQT
jgi:hypothetical protein